MLEIGLRLGERPAFGGDVAVVEAEARNAELGDELERRVELRLGGGERVLARRKPGAVKCAQAEDIRPRPVEGVPEADADPKLILHSLAQHYPVRVIDLERQRIRRTKPTEWG